MISHPSSRRAQAATTTKKIKIKILLPSRPADYKPGSGPPLRRVTLVPPSDSTAYIDDRILLPPAGHAADGRPMPKRMKYIVGWRDLPAARLLVSAMDILDYVSPHELEEWEYKMELELDEERARVEAERQVSKAPRAVLSSDNNPDAPVKRRPGRPPLHTKIEAAAVVAVDHEAKNGEQGRLRGGAMSLSTPKKRKMDDFLDGYSSDESPSEQLQFDFARSGSRPFEVVQPTKEEDEVPPSMQSVPRAHIAPMAPMAPMTPATPTTPMVIEDDYRYLSVKSQYSKKHRPATKIVLPLISSTTTRPKPERSESPGLPFPAAAAQPKGPVRASAYGSLHAQRPITEYLSAVQRKSSTPQSRPTAASSVPLEPQIKAQSEQKKAAAPLPQMTRNKTSSQPPPAKPSNVAENKAQSQPPATMPSHVAQKNTLSKPLTPTPTQAAKKNTQPPAVFRSHVAQKKQPAASDNDDSNDDDDDEPAWVVRHLEDMELYDVEGQGLVRLFKVRWEGDWPPDQNPTWEPEENIPDDLVSEFCRTFKPKRERSPRRQRAKQDHWQGENELPALKAAAVGGENRDEQARPSSAISGMFVYSSDDAMQEQVWDATNAQGLRLNLDGVYPARME
ncbi:hypothetical protein PWT90_08096 [Aphanocladium album]|nr:hypothetical protein PWT90_08096 [Aphanocladium album]